MIWAILIILAMALLFYICRPMFATPKPVLDLREGLNAYGEKIAELDRLIEVGEGDVSELVATKTALERKALEQEIDQAPMALISTKIVILPIVIVFGIASVFLYQQLGAHEMATPQTLDPAETARGLDKLPLDQLVIRLETNLQADPANPNGWVLYARSLMTLGRYDEALAAYDQVLSLTNRDDKIVTERASALRYIEQLQQNNAIETGPSDEDIKAAAQMTTEDRAEMIQNMVDGLSAKLDDDPKNEAGWIRLLKARNVLGQSELAAQEIEKMREVFEDQPETIERILRAGAPDIP